MLLLNRGRKLFYLAGVTLFGGPIVIRSNFGHTKVTPTIPRIDKLKMATVTLDHVDRFFGLPTDLLHWLLLYSRAGSQRGRGSWCWFEIVHDHPLFMNMTAKNNSSCECRLFIGAEITLSLPSSSYTCWEFRAPPTSGVGCEHMRWSCSKIAGLCLSLAAQRSGQEACCSF